MAISLQSIRREKASRPPIIAIHGTPGVGKTTWAAGAPGSIFIRTEDGLGNLEADAFPLATSFGDVMEALTVLYTEPHNFKWVVIDSLSALEPLLWAHVVGDVNAGKLDLAKKDQPKGAIRKLEDMGFGKGYLIAIDYWQQLFQALTSLATDRGIGSILIAHTDVVTASTPESDSYERSQIKLHKKAFQLVYERADVIGYAAPKIFTRNESLGKDFQGNDKVRKLGTASGERLLHLTDHPAYIAKNRYSLPETLPLSWGHFEAALAASLNTSTPTC
jgi:hypothetical protein